MSFEWTRITYKRLTVLKPTLALQSNQNNCTTPATSLFTRMCDKKTTNLFFFNARCKTKKKYNEYEVMKYYNIALRLVCHHHHPNNFDVETDATKHHMNPSK